MVIITNYRIQIILGLFTLEIFTDMESTDIKSRIFYFQQISHKNQWFHWL